MPFSGSTDVTGLLLAWSSGDEAALHRLVPILYEDLRRVAHRYMSRERSEHTLQTTALVREAYHRLVEIPRVCWQNNTYDVDRKCRRPARHLPYGPQEPRKSTFVATKEPLLKFCRKIVPRQGIGPWFTLGQPLVNIRSSSLESYTPICTESGVATAAGPSPLAAW